MPETVSMLTRAVFRCSACRYFDRDFCGNTMARRERADLREGECSFWRSPSSLSYEQRGTPLLHGQPLYG